MKHCSHSLWLNVSASAHESMLEESDRLQSLCHHFPNPDLQKPSLIVLVGNKLKSVALRKIFNVKRGGELNKKRKTGEIHLHLDPTSIFDRPLLLADTDFIYESCGQKTAATQGCHQTTTRALRPLGGVDTLYDLATSLFPLLLFPFADVICLFSADLGGFKQTAKILATWIGSDNPSTLPRSTYPKVLIVTDADTQTRGEESREAFLSLLKEYTTDDFSHRISSIYIVLLPDDSMSADARYRRLKECILNASDVIRENREYTQTLFTATHFSTMFRYACDNLAQPLANSFDVVRECRRHNPTATDLSQHLARFVNCIKSPQELITFAVPHIASSFLLDNYPPDAHFFHPGEVFERLYMKAIKGASTSRVIGFKNSQDIILRSGFVRRVELEFRILFESLTTQSSADVHRDNLKRDRSKWRDISSYSTCFSCLRRRPQYGLPCGHCICENCVVVFGKSVKDNPLLYAIEACFLCGDVFEIPIMVRVHPPTAGVGILCVDGGGTKAVLPLKFMKRIEDRIDLKIPLHRFFQLAFGTSSGGLVVMAMFLNGWSIDKSTKCFETLAVAAFKKRRKLPIPLLSGLYNISIAYIKDGLYSARNIEAALKAAFGTKRLLDYSNATLTGTRIGLPVATIHQPSSYVFTNYNGVGERDEEKGYHVIRPSDGFEQIPLWEIARSASAAPGFFPPKSIDGVGIFQDAGPFENNPLIAALSEAEAMCPGVQEPDFIVSLGTGIPPSASHNCLTPARTLRRWRDSTLPRLWRVFWERLQDHHVKRAFHGHPRYHRVDIIIPGDEPRLDNIERMQELQHMAESDHSIDEVINNIALCAIASTFYFELDPECIHDRGLGQSGFILCRIKKSDELDAFIYQLENKFATFYLNDTPLAGILSDCTFLDKNGNIKKQVSLGDQKNFSLSLKQGTSELCNISGSPFTIDGLRGAQELDAVFGRADHRKRKRSGSENLPVSKRQR